MLFIISGPERSVMLGIVREGPVRDGVTRGACVFHWRLITTNNDRSGDNACKFQL